MSVQHLADDLAHCKGCNLAAGAAQQRAFKGVGFEVVEHVAALVVLVERDGG